MTGKTEKLTVDDLMYIMRSLRQDAEVWLEDFLYGDDEEDALKKIIIIGGISRKIYRKLTRARKVSRK